MRYDSLLRWADFSGDNGGRGEVRPSTDLGNNKSDTDSDSQPLCDLFLWTRYTLPPPAGLAACLAVRRAPALCSLIEVDCGIISLIKFFHFLRLSLLSSCRTRVAERRPSSPLSSGASHPPPSLLIIVSITHPSSPSPVSLFLSHRSSSFLLLSHPKLLYTLLLILFFFTLRRPKSELGKIWHTPFLHSHISPSFPLSSLSVIRISQIFCDYFYLDLEISPLPPPSARKLSTFSVFGNQDWVGEHFRSKDKAALISLSALFL